MTDNVPRLVEVIVDKEKRKKLERIVFHLNKECTDYSEFNKEGKHPKIKLLDLVFFGHPERDISFSVVKEILGATQTTSSTKPISSASVES